MDEVFLSALKAEDWVLLDEMNLTSQSVLEGLNSVFDQHRRIFISELNETFYCPVSFHIFMCQVRSYFHLPFN
jgi:midasin